MDILYDWYCVCIIQNVWFCFVSSPTYIPRAPLYLYLLFMTYSETAESNVFFSSVSLNDSDGRCDSCSVCDWYEGKSKGQNLRILVNICNIGGFTWFVWTLQEALLSVLCQVLTGKSFELILAVAAVEGKLRTFVTKLLKFNECSKQIGGEGGKASQTRAMLFDVTFLMLCSIVHTYGPEVSWLSSGCFA